MVISKQRSMRRNGQQWLLLASHSCIPTLHFHQTNVTLEGSILQTIPQNKSLCQPLLTGTGSMEQQRRDVILQLLQAGNSTMQICKVTNYPTSTVYHVIKKFKANGLVRRKVHKERSDKKSVRNNHFAVCAPRGRRFHGCHNQTHHLRDIFIKEILGPMILAIQAPKDFKLGLIVIEKFELPVSYFL